MLVTNVICPNHLRQLIKVRLKTSADRMITPMSALVLRLVTMLKRYSICWARGLLRRHKVRVRHLRGRSLRSLEEESCVLKASVNSTLIWTEESNSLVRVKLFA